MIIDITGPNGNAFAVLGIVEKVIKDTHDKEEVDKIIKDMSSGDYEHLLDVAEEYVTIVGR